jgi:hypothetical protein
MLLPEKANAIENLPRARPRRLETPAKLRVLELEAFDALGGELGATGASVNGFHSRFGLQRAPPKAAQLFAKVADEPLKLHKRLCVRTIAVGFQVCSLVR